MQGTFRMHCVRNGRLNQRCPHDVCNTSAPCGTLESPHRSLIRSPRNLSSGCASHDGAHRIPCARRRSESSTMRHSCGPNSQVVNTLGSSWDCRGPRRMKAGIAVLLLRDLLNNTSSMPNTLSTQTSPGAFKALTSDP